MNPRQRAEKHRAKNSGWTVKVQPQRVTLRLVPPLAARHGNLGEGRRHRALVGKQPGGRGTAGRGDRGGGGAVGVAENSIGPRGVDDRRQLAVRRPRTPAAFGSPGSL
jgi:hypothetical protein